MVAALAIGRVGILSRGGGSGIIDSSWKDSSTDSVPPPSPSLVYCASSAVLRTLWRVNAPRHLHYTKAGLL
jgi:hypothetical protein